MGGVGCGRWYRFDTRATTDDFRKLDIRRMNQEGALRPDSFVFWTWRNSSGEKTASIGISAHDHFVVLRYRVSTFDDNFREMSYKVDLDWTACNFGGKRPWFLCPAKGCGRRVAVLYGGEYFICRNCRNLVYVSQREAREDRLMNRVRAIRRRLGGSESLLDSFPPRPTGMHHATYERLREEAETTESLGWRLAAIRFGIDASM